MIVQGRNKLKEKQVSYFEKTMPSNGSAITLGEEQSFWKYGKAQEELQAHNHLPYKLQHCVKQ